MNAYTPRAPAGVPTAAGGGASAVRESAEHPSTHGAEPSRAPAPVPPSGHNGPPATRAWPLRDFIELGALPGAVPCARHHVRQILWEWRLARLAETVELLVSELVTNAVTASRSTSLDSPVRLWLLSDTAQVLILVQDDSPHPPAPADLGADAERGRGLLLVEAISSGWDWYVPHPSGTGKVTWATLEIQDTQE